RIFVDFRKSAGIDRAYNFELLSLNRATMIVANGAASLSNFDVTPRPGSATAACRSSQTFRSAPFQSGGHAQAASIGAAAFYGSRSGWPARREFGRGNEARGIH